MYNRFTDKARKAMWLANQEAQRFGHDYIGTEHLLLGLLENAGLAVALLENLGIDRGTVRQEVEKIVVPGPFDYYRGRRPQTPRAKSVIEYAIAEARNFNHNYIGSEHLLIGLLREQEGVAGQVLTNLGLRLSDLHEEMLYLLSTPRAPRKSPAPVAVVPEPPASSPVNAGSNLERVLQASLDTQQRRIGVLERQIGVLDRQLASARFLFGAFTGSFAGWFLGGPTGAVMGLLLGGVVALLGRFVPAALTGSIAGGLIGSTHLSEQGGCLAGALLGILLGASIAELGRSSRRASRGCCMGVRGRRGKRCGDDSPGAA
jgi:hypothetical protein